MKYTAMTLALLASLTLAGCSTTHSTHDHSSSATNVSRSADHSDGQSQSEAVISLPKIWSIFTQRHSDAAVTSLEVEHQQIEVKGMSTNQEYELTLAAATGKVLHAEAESLDADEQQGRGKVAEGIKQAGLQSLAQVTDLAEKHVGTGKATAWQLEKEHGTTTWEVTVRHGQSETEVTVDAYSGKILHSEQD